MAKKRTKQEQGDNFVKYRIAFICIFCCFFSVIFFLRENKYGGHTANLYALACLGGGTVAVLITLGLHYLSAKQLLSSRKRNMLGNFFLCFLVIGVICISPSVFKTHTLDVSALPDGEIYYQVKQERYYSSIEPEKVEVESVQQTKAKVKKIPLSDKKYVDFAVYGNQLPRRMDCYSSTEHQNFNLKEMNPVVVSKLSQNRIRINCRKDRYYYVDAVYDNGHLYYVFYCD